jgi:hypothetical protein
MVSSFVLVLTCKSSWRRSVYAGKRQAFQSTQLDLQQCDSSVCFRKLVSMILGSA